MRLFSIYSNSTHLVVFEILLWQAKTPVFMAGVFCLLACHPHRGRCRFMGGQVICSFIASSYAYDTGEWSFLQGTQAYQLSMTHKKCAPCEGALLCVDYFPVSLSALPVDVPKEE